MIHSRHDVTPRENLPHVLKTTIALLLAVLPLAICPAIAAQTRKADDTELRKVMDLYAEAVNKADAKLGSQVWCGSEEDSVTNPGGHWQGPQQINAFYAVLSDSYSERRLTFDTVSIHSYGNFAWTEFTGDFAAKQGKDGTPVSFHAAETQIYRKLKGKWCLLHVHYGTFPAQPVREKK
jgi:ketosteroid isomerase-like protein